METKVCTNCGGSFSSKKSNEKYGWGKFCSKNCHSKSMIVDVVMKCPVCKESFKKRPSDRKSCCSRRCANYKKSLRIPKDELERLYLVERKSSIQIGVIFNTSKKIILGYLKKYNITTRSHTESRHEEGFAVPSKAELEKLYLQDWLSYDAICKIYDVDKTTIPYWLKKHNIPIRSASETSLGKDFKEPTESEMKQWYVEQELSTREIAQMLGVSRGLVSRRLKIFDISLRSNIWGYDGMLECKDGHKVRSSYERAFDNYLYACGIEHEYEPRLPCNKRYASDFKVGNVYIEIWGVTNNKKYEQRKKKKKNMYDENNYKLLDVHPNDFKDIKNIVMKLKRLLAS